MTMITNLVTQNQIAMSQNKSITEQNTLLLQKILLPKEPTKDSSSQTGSRNTHTIHNETTQFDNRSPTHPQVPGNTHYPYNHSVHSFQPPKPPIDPKNNHFNTSSLTPDFMQKQHK